MYHVLFSKYTNCSIDIPATKILAALQAGAPVGSLHQATYLRTERLSTSVGEFWWFFLVSTSPSRSGALAGPNSCVGFAVELVVHPGRLDELFPAVQQDWQHVG